MQSPEPRGRLAKVGVLTAGAVGGTVHLQTAVPRVMSGQAVQPGDGAALPIVEWGDRQSDAPSTSRPLACVGDGSARRPDR